VRGKKKRGGLVSRRQGRGLVSRKGIRSRGRSRCPFSLRFAFEISPRDLPRFAATRQLRCPFDIALVLKVQRAGCGGPGRDKKSIEPRRRRPHGFSRHHRRVLPFRIHPPQTIIPQPHSRARCTPPGSLPAVRRRPRPPWPPRRRGRRNGGGMRRSQHRRFHGGVWDRPRRGRCCCYCCGCRNGSCCMFRRRRGPPCLGQQRRRKSRRRAWRSCSFLQEEAKKERRKPESEIGKLSSLFLS